MMPLQVPQQKRAMSQRLYFSTLCFKLGLACPFQARCRHWYSRNLILFPRQARGIGEEERAEAAGGERDERSQEEDREE